MDNVVYLNNYKKEKELKELEKNKEKFINNFNTYRNELLKAQSKYKSNSNKKLLLEQ